MTARDPSAPIAYRPDIDGLRAVAVLSVIGFHAFPNLVSSGFIGVDIFFVLSGYLISSIIFRALDTGSFSFREFYARRIRRIFPALLLVLLASLAYGWFVSLSDEYRQLGKHVAAGTTFVSNFVLWHESGYFDNAAETKPLLHLWSLAIEEQFYIVWPLVMVVAYRRRWNFLLVASAITLISFSFNIFASHQSPVATFYSPLSRVWELMAGAMLSYLALYKRGVLTRWTDAQSVVGLLLLAWGFLVISPRNAFPGWWALLPTLGTVLVVSAGPSAWANRVLLSHRWAVWLGLISYPLYLWHWPLLVWSKITIGELASPLQRIVMVALSVVLAWLTYRWVEKRFRSGASTLGVRHLLILLGCVGGIATAAMSGWIGSRHQSPELEKVLAAKLDWSYPGNTFRRLTSSSLRAFAAGDGSSKTVFIGDSNMEQYAPRINHLLRLHPSGHNTAVLVGNQQECHLLKELIERQGQCDNQVAALRQLAEARDVSAVVLAASWASYAPLLQRDANNDNLLNFIASLSKDKRVFLVLNMPSGRELDPDTMFAGTRLTTLKARNTEDIRFNAQNFADRFGAVHQQLKWIAARSGATIIDPQATLCAGGVCPVFDGQGRPLYMDESHLTASYAARAATFIDATLEPPISRADPVKP